MLDARAEARTQLAREAAHAGAEGAVLADSYESVSEHECYLVEGGRDHVVRNTYLGTGIARFSKSAERPGPGALPILRLDRNRYTDSRATTRTPARTNVETP